MNKKIATPVKPQAPVMRIRVTSEVADHAGRPPALDAIDPMLHVEIQLAGARFKLINRDGVLEVYAPGENLAIEPVAANVVRVRAVPR